MMRMSIDNRIPHNNSKSQMQSNDIWKEADQKNLVLLYRILRL